MDALLIFGISLGLTLAIELPVAALWGVRDFRTVLVANLMTNPLAVALRYWGLDPIPIELGVVLAEWWAYRLHGFRRPFLLALGSNALSYMAGLLL